MTRLLEVWAFQKRRCCLRHSERVETFEGGGTESEIVFQPVSEGEN